MVNVLGVRDMKKEWAACSANGNLNFSSELAGMDNELQDYVIVHELLYFSVPNYGKLWKSRMTAHLRNYRALVRRLGAQHQ